MYLVGLAHTTPEYSPREPHRRLLAALEGELLTPSLMRLIRLSLRPGWWAMQLGGGLPMSSLFSMQDLPPVERASGRYIALLVLCRVFSHTLPPTGADAQAGACACACACACLLAHSEHMGNSDTAIPACKQRFRLKTQQADGRPGGVGCCCVCCTGGHGSRHHHRRRHRHQQQQHHALWQHA